MDKYIELTFANDNNAKVTLRINSIQSITELPQNFVPNTKDCCKIIVGSNQYYVKGSYDEIKNLIINSNESRYCLDNSVDFRIKYLIREGLMNLSKRMGKEAVDYIKKIMDAIDEDELFTLRIGE